MPILVTPTTRLLERILPVAMLVVAVVGAPVMIFAPQGLPRLRGLEKELGDVDDENAALAALLDKAAVSYRTVREADASAAAFAPRGVTFVPTTLPHDDVPTGHHFLATTLASSRLSRTPGR